MRIKELAPLVLSQASSSWIDSLVSRGRPAPPRQEVSDRVDRLRTAILLHGTAVEVRDKTRRRPAAVFFLRGLAAPRTGVHHPN